MNRKSWDSVWEEIFQDQEWGKYPSEDLIRFVARNFYAVKVKNDVKILEVGCGPGANLWYVAREGFQAFGIDGSETGVKRALARLNREVPDWNGEIKVGDISELPYENQIFDAVIDNEAIYANTYENSKIIISEIFRVLKRDGKLYSRTFATGSLGDGSGEKVGHNAWLAKDGGLQGKGLSRFTSRKEINDLFRAFHIDQVNLLERSVDGIESARSIKEWIIWMTKK